MDEQKRASIPRATRRKNLRRCPCSCPNNWAAKLEPEDLEFMKAMDAYKRDNRRPFPTWCEVLDVLKALGYRKVAPENVEEIRT